MLDNVGTDGFWWTHTRRPKSVNVDFRANGNGNILVIRKTAALKKHLKYLRLIVDWWYYFNLKSNFFKLSLCFQSLFPWKPGSTYKWTNKTQQNDHNIVVSTSAPIISHFSDFYWPNKATGRRLWCVPFLERSSQVMETQWRQMHSATDKNNSMWDPQETTKSVANNEQPCAFDLWPEATEKYFHWLISGNDQKPRSYVIWFQIWSEQNYTVMFL